MGRTDSTDNDHADSTDSRQDSDVWNIEIFNVRWEIYFFKMGYRMLSVFQ